MPSGPGSRRNLGVHLHEVKEGSKPPNQAGDLSLEADLYLAIGSSLVVEPAASLPRLAKEHGAKLVILNKTETPLDGLADLILRESIGDTMRAVVQRLDSQKK